MDPAAGVGQAAAAPPVAVGVAVGAAPRAARHSLPAEGATWTVTVDFNGEAMSEPWLMHGGVPKHDVAHCYKPRDGLTSAEAQSKGHQEAHTLACLKRQAKKVEAETAAAEKAAAKDESTSRAKAAAAAAAQAKEQEDANRRQSARCRGESNLW